MAFVILPGKKEYVAWQRLSFTLGCAHTTLAGKDDRAVLAIPDFARDELAERGIAFTALPEARLQEYLTPQGFAYYEHLRQHQPDYLYFNAPLPPALHVVMSCNVPETLTEAVRQIVERYDPVAFRTTEITLLAIPTEPDSSADVQAMVHMEFTVPRVH